MSAATRSWAIGDEALRGMPNVFRRTSESGPVGLPGGHAMREKGVIGTRLVQLELCSVVSDSLVQVRGFDPDTTPADQALLESLREQGQKTPIKVEEIQVDGQTVYRLKGGHRRVAALRLLGATRVLALVQRETPEASDLHALIDNLSEPLNPLQLGQTIRRIRERHGLSTSRIAALSGIPRQRISEIEAVLAMSPEVQAEVEQARITVRAAHALRGLAPEAQQQVVAALGGQHLAYDQAMRVAERVQQGEAVGAALCLVGIKPGAEEEPAPADAASESDGAPESAWATAWLRENTTHLGVDLCRDMERLSQEQTMTPKSLALALLLVEGGVKAGAAMADAATLAGTECGRVLVRLVTQVERLERLQRAGRFTQALTPGLRALGERLNQLEAERKQGRA